MLSHARSCVAHNGSHLTDVVIHASKYKTSIHSLSFAVSFVLFGAIARSHDKYSYKGASRLLGHPVFVSAFYRVSLRIYQTFGCPGSVFYIVYDLSPVGGFVHSVFIRVSGLSHH